MNQQKNKNIKYVAIAMWEYTIGRKWWKTGRLALLLSLIFIAASCSEKKDVAKKKDDGHYTCSMHPQVMEQEPGKCPICGMELIKVNANSKEMEGLQLSEEQIKLANIKTDTVKVDKIGKDIMLTGITRVNENLTNTISSWIPGRIEKLYFKNTGETIRKGQVLYEIYSEELLSTQKEYLLALEKQKLIKESEIDYSQILKALKNKLLLWGMTDEQIEKLQTIGDVKSTVPVRSKESGTILEINVSEGDYVMEGTTLYKLADLSTLWVEAELYANELMEYGSAKNATVRLAAFSNQEIQAKVTFVNPELTSQSKVNLIRVQILNKDMAFTPGMQAYVTLSKDEVKALVVPVNAVLREEKMNSVWIRNKEGSFENRMVELGIQDDYHVAIKDGLKEGDIVVVSGAYLLNSEYIFRNGADPMAGMDMSGMEM